MSTRMQLFILLCYIGLAFSSIVLVTRILKLEENMSTEQCSMSSMETYHKVYDYNSNTINLYLQHSKDDKLTNVECEEMIDMYMDNVVDK